MSQTTLLAKPAGVALGDMGYFSSAGKLTKVGGTLGTGKVPTVQSDGTIQWASAGSAPTGPAGGVLSGTYPNPGFAVDMATQAEFDAHVNDTSDAHDASAISIVDSGSHFTGTDVEAALAELGAGGGGGGISQATADSLYRRRGLQNICSPVQDLHNIIGTVATVGVNSGRACRVVVPKDGSLNDLWIYIGGAAAGQNLVGAIFDVGATTSAVRTRVRVGSTIAIGSTLNNVWLALGPFTGGALTVTAGTVLDLAFVVDNSTTQVGRATTQTTSNWFPDAFGLTNGCKPKFTYSFAPGSFTMPSSLADSDLVAASNWFPLVAVYA